MLRFQYPELLLLALPAAIAFWRWGRARGMTGWLRAAILAVLLLALSGPEVNVGGRGIDVIVVADRSRSLPAGAHENIRELIGHLIDNRGTGDRVAVVSFGATAAVDRLLPAAGEFAGYRGDVSPEGSDLHEALLTAVNHVDPRRPARILVLSDGEVNGPSPEGAAARADEAGVPIDYRLFERVRAGDAAVESLELPRVVAPREAFQFTAIIVADASTRATLRLLRDGEIVSEATRDLAAGRNVVPFADAIERGGTHNYAVEVNVVGDPTVENNRGAGVVRVEEPPRLLVLNTDGAEGNLVQALRAGRVPVDVAVARRQPLTLDQLDRYRAVIVENVPADHLGRRRMQRLVRFVEDLGGGLMLTGGERSFGAGGYFKSPLDPLLPVSMELRDEVRKHRVALAIALDRSGSMAAPVRGNQTKMDLANLGAAECVRLLSAFDMVAVLAVDTSPHVVQPLARVENKQAIASRIRSIQSAGGGIFVYEALRAAGDELLKARGYPTRHIILFSDAQDSENPGEFRELLREFARRNITVSVIGLGRETDVHAELLKEIARLGGGNIFFTDDPEDLPRLFTQDAMSIARSTFIKKDEDHPEGFAGRRIRGPHIVGRLGSGPFPRADGYNLSYLKPDAQAAVVSADEHAAPWSAFWHRGLGRVAAIGLEVDGEYSGAFGRWDGYADFLITHARWMLGGDDPQGVFVEVELDGQDALLTVELDPELDVARRGDPPELLVVPPEAEPGEIVTPRLEFSPTETHVLTARFRLDRLGTWRTLVVARSDRLQAVSGGLSRRSEKNPRRRKPKTTNGRAAHQPETDAPASPQIVRGPSITLPYSAEFLPRAGRLSGKETLSRLAERTGGLERTNVLEVFADPPRAPATTPLLPWLLAVTLVLLIVEIAGRRLSLWERLPRLRGAESAAAGEREGWLPRWRMRLLRRRHAAGSSPSSAAAESESLPAEPESLPPAAVRRPSEAVESASEGRSTAAPHPSPAASSSSASVFEQAKQRARRRMSD